MSFQIDTTTAKWLLQIRILTPQQLQRSNNQYLIDEQTTKCFENGTKISSIVQEIYRSRGLPPPQYLDHLKVSSQTAAQLYNWNYLNQALKKLNFEVDPQTKNLIINGDRPHLAMTLRRLHNLHGQNDLEDSLDQETLPVPQISNQLNSRHEQIQKSRESLTLSHSQDVQIVGTFGKRQESRRRQVENLQKLGKGNSNLIPNKSAEGDLLQFVLEQLMSCIGISRQQAITLLQDNNKYLAHILVKGVKGEFQDIQKLMERWFKRVDFIVQQMGQQNDMCFFFLQVLKPSLLSKSQQIAQWGCRLLSRIAHELANQDLLPLAYDWFVREAGGLSTTLLALTRHPKLNQHIVGFILEFSRYNVAQVFTVELKKITNQDQLAYIKFVLLIFEPLVESKQTAEQLLNAGAIDYWVETSLRGAQVISEGVELKLLCLELLTKIWRAYSVHVQETLDKVGQIMGLIKRGIREGSSVVRFSLLQLLFSLLDQFATRKNPYASVVYKKLTFLFIENHQELQVREFMLRNFTLIISKYPSIPVDIFLQPFVKQVKIKENESYFLNIFDLEFINLAVSHPRLRPEVALEFFDLLAKITLNNYDFTYLARKAMDTLLDRFLQKDIFLHYTAKLVKVSLAKFYNSFKHKKQREAMNDHERLQAQKRAQIINLILDLLERGTPLTQPLKLQDKHTGFLNDTTLYEEIKAYTIQVKIQIQRVVGTTHKGIEKILEMFPNIQQQVKQAIQNAMQKEETESNISSQPSNQGFRLPKIEPKYLSKDRDETSSQQSSLSQGTRYSQKAKEFPQQDYTKFAQEDEQKFLKQHGIGFKKRERARKPPSEVEVDPKVQQQLMRARLRKEEEQRKKAQQQQKIQKRKQMLKNKIQKQLQQRNIMQGVKGVQKDVAVRVVFDQNQINQKLIDDEQVFRNMNLEQEEDRDTQSIRLVLKKYTPFLKKVFNRYSCGKVNKKDFFEEESDSLAQIDLLRMCKEKNLEKNKQIILEIIKQSNDKNIKSLSFENFFKFLEALTTYLYIKDKCSTHQPMGDLTKSLLKKLAVGENFKLEEQQDQMTRGLTEKVRYNPHIELPDGYKKIYQRVYEPKRQCSYPTKKAINNQSFTTCYQVVNQMLYNIFKVHLLQEEVRFYEEARVIKKNMVLPPRPVKKEKQEPVALLEEREAVPSNKGKRPASNFQKSNRINESVEKENSRPKAKIVNAAEKRRLEQQQTKRQKKQQEQQDFRRRQAQIKKRFQKMQEEKQRQLSKQKQEKQLTRQQQQQKKRREKQKKQKERKEQKDKLQRYKREKEQKQKEEKQKQKMLKQQEQEQRRQKLKLQMKREEAKRKEEAQRSKKQRQLSQEKNRKKKEQEQKKQRALRQTVQKKLQEEKQKYQVQKLYKQLLKNIYQQKQVQNIFNNFREELKGLYSYGKQYNEYRLGEKQPGLQARGWNTICQQFDLADPSTANALLKNNQKEKGRPGFLFDDFQQILLSLAARQKDLEGELDNYDKARDTSCNRLQDLLRRLKIPRDKGSMKDYFVGLKNSLKKREEVQVVGPGGQKETWQVEGK